MNVSVFKISKDQTTAPADAKVIGGKAFSLVTMSKIGLPVPPAVVIPCAATASHKLDPSGTIQSAREGVAANLQWIVTTMGRLSLFSVRSGAPISMPGMMDTILNVGLNDETLPIFNDLLGQRAVWDSYRRLHQMYGTVVLGLPDADFQKVLSAQRKKHNVETDGQLPWEALRDAIEAWRKASPELAKLRTMSVVDQVMACVGAVFKSWDSERAIEYRKLNGIADDMGTAVTIQAMVYGNLNDKSGSGVLFTRNPSTGEKSIMAEFLSNAQGEDVVAGTHTPKKLTIGTYSFGSPKGWTEELTLVCTKLEDHFRDMMDVEFTVEDGNLYILQSRRGKRTPRAALRIATDLLKEKVIEVADLHSYVKSADVCKAAGKVIVDTGKAKLIGKGLPAGGGVACGQAMATVEDAVEYSKQGPVVLVRPETTPDDIKGMAAAVAIVTEKGGTTSHAAVVSRAMNKACVTGVGAVDNDFMESFSGTAGAWVVVNGDTGEVWSDPDKTMKIDDGGESLIEELAAEIARNNGVRVLSIRCDLGVPTAIRAADMLFNVSLLELLLKGEGGDIVLDATNPHTLTHKDDGEMWDLLGPWTIDPLYKEVTPALVKRLSKTTPLLTVLASGEWVFPGVKQVREAHTIDDLFSGDPVTIGKDFVEKVVGSQAMLVKLIEKIGVPNLFVQAMTPYQVVMAACAAG